MTPLLSVRGLTKFYGSRVGCRGVEFDLFSKIKILGKEESTIRIG